MSITVNCHTSEKTDVSRTYAPHGPDQDGPTYGVLKFTEGYPGVTLFFRPEHIDKLDELIAEAVALRSELVPPTEGQLQTLTQQVAELAPL